MNRRRFVAGVVAVMGLAAIWGAETGWAQTLRFFRIGTGPTGGTYFAVGGLIASALSNPPGSRECDKGGSCGVPGMIAVAQSTHGSVANVEGIKSRQFESAIVQADVAYWAYHGAGIYEGKGAAQNLRAIARLYPESLHVVTKIDSKIRSFPDLRGKRVSLGEKGSGTLVEARFILKAFGLKESDVKVKYLAPGPAADLMRKGELDAFFAMEGAPAGAVTALADAMPIALLPIDAKDAAKLRKTYPFLVPGGIPADTYKGVALTPTIDVNAVLVVGSEVDNDLVEQITRALWHPNSRKILESGHAKGKLMDPDLASENTGVPLHAGAADYYFEAKANSEGTKK